MCIYVYFLIILETCRYGKGKRTEMRWQGGCSKKDPADPDDRKNGEES